MKSSELAVHIANTISDCVSRATGPAAAEYNRQADTQAFEGKSISELLIMMEEETEDLINYGVMVTIRLKALQKVMEDAAGVNNPSV